MSHKIDIKYINENCKLTKGTEGAIAFDVRANINKEVTIHPGECKMIPLGFSIDTKDKNIGCFLFIRSGMGFKHGLTLLNGTGIIDSDYRGEFAACIYNTGAFNKSYTIQPLERCGQMVFLNAVDVELNTVTELSMTNRGTGGFGSTGRD